MTTYFFDKLDYHLLRKIYQHLDMKSKESFVCSIPHVSSLLIHDIIADKNRELKASEKFNIMKLGCVCCWRFVVKCEKCDGVVCESRRNEDGYKWIEFEKNKYYCPSCV